MSELKDIEKERAIFSYEKVEEAIADRGLKHSEYKSYCKKIPSMIQTNGLGATFAFMFSKKTGTYIFIYRQVEEWLNKKHLKTNSEYNDLMKKLIKLDSAKYRKITIEVLALFAWLRRFAEGKISKEKDDGTGQTQS